MVVLGPRYSILFYRGGIRGESLDSTYPRPGVKRPKRPKVPRAQKGPKKALFPDFPPGALGGPFPRSPHGVLPVENHENPHQINILLRGPHPRIPGFPDFPGPGEIPQIPPFSGEFPELQLPRKPRHFAGSSTTSWWSSLTNKATPRGYRLYYIIII